MATAFPSPVKRKPKCMYGGKCYRKDSDHKKQYAHPGDEESAHATAGGSKTSKKFDLQGKRIVFTGTLKNGTRKQAEARAKVFGCFVGAAVAKNIDLVVAGEEAGEKADKAEKLGVKVYSEQEWEDLLLQSKPVRPYKASSKNKDAAQASDSEDELFDPSPKKKPGTGIPAQRKRKTHDISDNEESQEMSKAPTKITDGDTSDTDVEGDTATPPKKTKKAAKDDAEEEGTVPKLTRSRSSSMSKKPKCKFWDKCYRKNADHLKDFLHPHDVLSEESGDLLVRSVDLPKNMDVEFDDDADASTPLPLHVMKDGEKVDIKGGLHGEYTYSIKRIGGHYSCTCVSWKTQGKAVDKRTCRHLKSYLGEDFELYRIGKMTGGAGDEVITRAPRHKSIGSLLLAHKWTESVNPTGWWMSEKLDGVRAFWDGKTFYSRLGNEFIAPSWFTKDFPSGMTLDGELFGGRGKFQSTVSIVKTAGSGRWSEIKYFIFDAPDTKLPFEGRLEAIHDYFDKKKVKTVTVLEHVKCKGVEHLKGELKKVEARGGEGLMIREPKSKYEHRRSNSLLKIKTFHDAEALVIGHEKGKGRNASVMGALVCKMECGKTFKVGTGFSDKQRQSPPKKGSIITYRFQEYTNSGVPRFPSYVGIRIDMDGPKDVILPDKAD